MSGTHTDRRIPHPPRTAFLLPLPGLLAALGFLGILGMHPAAGPSELHAQDATARFDRGATGAGLLLRQMDGVKRVLMIGAHPDDENTALLAALARGHGARTAYLSLTRGDGGQNLIGPELNEGLGVIRSGELVSARSLDGGVQYFTRAMDYGYSKSAEEAFTQWPREELLRDVVRVIRTFRPQVVISVFTGTPSDGHGQHEAAGIVAREAFAAAADPGSFPDQLTEAGGGLDPWQPGKLYVGAWRTPEGPATEIETGVFDPLLGKSWYQLAMESRSRHRSQDMGAAEPPGPRAYALTLAATAPGVEADPAAGLFAGVDTALTGLVRAAGIEPSRADDVLESYRQQVADARKSLNALSPSDAVPALAGALRTLRRFRDDYVTGGADPGASRLRAAVEHRLALAEEALRDASGVVVEARAADDVLVPGQRVEVEVTLWNGGPFALEDASGRLDLPDGWWAEPLPPAPEDESPFRGRGGSRSVAHDVPVAVAPGESVVWRWSVTVPDAAELSRLYYLEEPRDGAMYRWPDDPALRGLPRDPAPVHGGASFALGVGGGADRVSLGPRVAARYRGVDPALGEFTRPLLVAPALSVSAAPGVMVVPTGSTGSTDERTVTVSLRAFAPDGAVGTLRLEAPAGWSVEPASVPFRLGGEGSEQSVAFTVRPPAGAEPGRVSLQPVATTDDGGRYAEGVSLIDYPHIEPALMFDDGATEVTVVDVRVAEGRRVGYVMGSGDEGLEALRQLGVDAELVGPAALRGGDLSAYDAIVLGIRAYEVRDDLRANNERLLQWVREGGTLIVQYNRYEFPAGGWAPYPVEMSRPHDRVTDEGSPVAFVEPASPVFTTPNEIDPVEDFEGWVTERGLYFLGEWDERYTPVLSLTDFGEEPKLGSILVAPVGEGLWVYTGISFFRQLPEGVPGAYRLFANLVSLTPEGWAAWEAGR